MHLCQDIFHIFHSLQCNILVPLPTLLAGASEMQNLLAKINVYEPVACHLTLQLTPNAL